MQTILGSGGIISKELENALREYTTDIRIVSRNPKAFDESNELISADLTNAEEALKAVEGSEIAYLTIGLPYSYKAWHASWPVVMENIINACKTHGTKLVFFDNIYMYDSNNLNGMTEETPINPPSKKGEIRAEIAKMIMDDVREGKLTALIARSADFYGPEILNNSMLTETVFKPLSIGKKANWMSSVNFKHSFTYTPDAGKATALLGNTEDAYNQVWHLPTAADPLTGKEWIEAIAKEIGVEPKYQAAPKFLVRIIGLFVPIMREMVEMMYQYDRDYVFDSSKFEKRFDFRPTPYIEGIREIVKVDYKTTTANT